MSLGRELTIEECIESNLLHIRADDMASKGLWTMKDGRTVCVRDMTDAHITNCVNMLKRGNSPYAEPFICMFEEEQKRRNK